MIILIKTILHNFYSYEYLPTNKNCDKILLELLKKKQKITYLRN